MVRIRGIACEDNPDNRMGLEFYNLSHRFGFQNPNWPYFQDTKIERIHYMAKSGVLSQRITTTMHATTHIDAPAHVVQGTPFIDEVALPHFFGTGIVVGLPKKKWAFITGDDLEQACGHAIRPGDVLIINTGWHKQYEDGDYFAYCPGFVPSAGEWMVEKGVKVVGHHTQANDHPLATAIGPQRNGPLLPHLKKEWAEHTGGNDWEVDFPEWEPVHQWLGLSLFLPGGGAGPDATPFEKVYLVLEGRMTVITAAGETDLGPLDSCTIAPGEVREIVNRSNHVCKMLVVIPYPPKVA